MSDSLLLLENVTYCYGIEKNIINDVSLNINQDEIVSIIGKSGSGKTTLLNLISGLLKPNSGSVKLNNVNHQGTTRLISYLSQQPVLLSYRTAYENSLLSAEIRNEVDQNTVKNAKQLFKVFGINESEHKFPSELSGGMKQRVGIIQCLLSNALLYILDEPFNAIDKNLSSIIEDYMWNNLKAKRSSCIIVTHDLEQAVSLSDKIFLLSGSSGKIEQIMFDRDFTSQLPTTRRRSKYFDEYLFQLIKNISQ